MYDPQKHSLDAVYCGDYYNCESCWGSSLQRLTTDASVHGHKEQPSTQSESAEYSSHETIVNDVVGVFLE